MAYSSVGYVPAIKGLQMELEDAQKKAQKYADQVKLLSQKLEELTSEPEHPLPMTIDELLKGASVSANNVPATRS